MSHSKREVEAASQRFEELVDKLDPATADVEQLDDLHEVAVRADAVNEAESALRHAVLAARSNGRSWNRIAIALGVSRQAARQRFGNKTAV